MAVVIALIVCGLMVCVACCVCNGEISREETPQMSYDEIIARIDSIIDTLSDIKGTQTLSNEDISAIDDCIASYEKLKQLTVEAERFNEFYAS